MISRVPGHPPECLRRAHRASHQTPSAGTPTLDWAGAIRAYGQGLMEQPLLGMHYAANLERARAATGNNAAGRAYTLAQLYRHTGQQGLPVHSVVVEREPGFGSQAWELVLQQPTVVFGLLYKLLCNGLPEPRELMGPRVA